MRTRSEEHTSELQSHSDLVCRLLLDPPPPQLYTLSLHDALPISWFGNHVTYEEWRSWQRRPRIYPRDANLVRAVIPGGNRWAIESQEILWANTPYARPRQVDAHEIGRAHV